jgi:hypothetical protein
MRQNVGEEINFMVPHSYLNASDAPDQYDADMCGRQAVTPEFAWEHLCDEPLYLYSKKAGEMGTDPWIIVTGMDKLNDGRYIAEFGTTGHWILHPDQYLFAQRSTLRKLGLPDGAPGGLPPVSCAQHQRS